MIDLPKHINVAKKLVLHECPACKAEEGKPCRTPKGRKKAVPHDTRPFSLVVKVK